MGWILAEAATELMYELFPRIPHPALRVVATGVDWAELTNLRRESMLTGRGVGRRNVRYQAE